MTRAQALWAAIGVSVAAHVWMLTDWGPRASAPEPLRTGGQTPGGMTLRWVSLAAPARPKATLATVSPHGGPAREAPQASPKVNDVRDQVGAPYAGTTPSERFWLPSEVDFRALPLEAPDTTPLDSTPWSTDQLVRLRLAIDAHGQVVGVTARDAAPPPAEVLAALTAMFKATSFMPARRQGENVASLQDIEILPPCGGSGTSPSASAPSPCEAP